MAHDLCGNVVQILDKTEKTLDGKRSLNFTRVVECLYIIDNAGYGFAILYEVEEELASSSCFLTLIGCSPDAAQGRFYHFAVNPPDSGRVPSEAGWSI